MIRFRGYGLLIVLADYVGGMTLLSKFAPKIFKTDKQQYIVLFLFHVLITLINFCLIKYLNRKEVKHTIFELKLEIVVLVLGGILLLPLIMMGKDIIY